MSQPNPNPYAPPNAPIERAPELAPEAPLAREGLEGLGGWLALVGFGLIVSPLRLLIFTLQTYAPLVRDGSLRAIATPQSPDFHPALAAIVVIQALANVFCFAFGIWLIVLFFQKSRRFPPRYVALAAFSVAIIIADALALGSLGIGSPWDAETVREFSRSLITLLVWGPYMFMSKRVKNTFVH